MTLCGENIKCSIKKKRENGKVILEVKKGGKCEGKQPATNYGVESGKYTFALTAWRSIARFMQMIVT